MADDPPAFAPMMAVVEPARRRQRSVRVTLAVTLLVVATVLVLVAVPGQSRLWLSTAAVVSLGCGWAAARILYVEVVQSRREAAADRAAQARAYRTLYAERATEHAEFTAVMADRLVESDQRVRELAGQVSELEATLAVADLVAWEAHVGARPRPADRKQA